MCGILGILGKDWKTEDLHAMILSQKHRGPDAEDFYIDAKKQVGLGHNRLSIIDLSDAARQPMTDSSGRYKIVFNGEIYNYLELKKILENEYIFRTQSDTEVLLAAYQKWGEDCLDRLIGMFAFIIWDEIENKAFAARDRFGVKPLYYHQKNDGTLLISSEIKALHAAGVTQIPNEKTWATYLTYGLYDHSHETFWAGIYNLPAGHKLNWSQNHLNISRWYDLASFVGDEIDTRPEEIVKEEYLALMKESVIFRFRSDVPVGINLSGGLDSSSLLGLVQEVQGKDNDVKAFTFITGDERYDELPWVEQMLEKTRHPLISVKLQPEEIPALAASVQYHQDEPYSGIPTLAYAKLFETAKQNGVTVLLDGNGLDEQWCGYDYYQKALDGEKAGVVQGTNDKPVKPECLMEEFKKLAEPVEFPTVFKDKIRNLQYRDTFYTKIPRAMRFNDRISMRASTELREPFLDHRLFELAFRQPTDRKLANGIRKKLLREIMQDLVPKNLTQTPKRPLQTPQREWLKDQLFDWADSHINNVAGNQFANWFKKNTVLDFWKKFCQGESDNSFYIWQWINIGLR